LVASLIEVPYRPVGAAIAGLAFMLLRGLLARPDLPEWFVAIGLLGAIPGFICSWVTMKIQVGTRERDGPPLADKAEVSPGANPEVRV
jgi:hypothetical protein